MKLEIRREMWPTGMEKAVVTMEKVMQAMGVESTKEVRKIHRLGEDIYDTSSQYSIWCQSMLNNYQILRKE